MTSKGLRVLISAYACEPNKGSEPGVGWHWSIQVARFAEVWTITRMSNRSAIEEELNARPLANIRFVYVDLPRWLTFWKKGQRGLYVYYMLWQIIATGVAFRLYMKKKFDICHHLTYGNIWMPTFVSCLPIYFVWGPLGGGERVPKSFRVAYSLKQKLQEKLRDFVLYTLQSNPVVVFNTKRASAIIARTEDTARVVPTSQRSKVHVHIETAMQSQTKQSGYIRGRAETLVVLCVGRLLHWKGFDLAIKSFAKASRDYDAMQLMLIGQGPDKRRLEEICRDEGIAHKVAFLGQVSHSRVLDHMHASSVFLHPSLKEAGAWVLFEAMNAGLPVICLDVAGAAIVVGSECGVRIPVSDPKHTIDALSVALLRLARDNDLRARMGAAAKERILRCFTWEQKCQFIKNVYNSVTPYEDIVCT